MNSLQPLMSLLAQTERERDQALQSHLRLEAQLAAAHQQAEQLLAYRREYELKWGTQFGQLGHMPVVHCYQNFNDRLTQAVQYQQAAVEQARVQAEKGRLFWQEQEIRVASVRKLIERRLTEQQLSADRRDQKATDEFAARARWGRHSGLGAI
jgi:flagellar protein FliJ